MPPSPWRCWRNAVRQRRCFMLFGGAEILILLVWLVPVALAIYGVVLAARLVRAVERIADGIDKRA